MARYNGPGSGLDEANGVVSSPDGSKVFVTGRSNNSSTGYDYATIAYDAATGAPLWTQRYNGTGSEIFGFRGGSFGGAFRGATVGSFRGATFGGFRSGFVGRRSFAFRQGCSSPPRRVRGGQQHSPHAGRSERSLAHEEESGIHQ